VKFKAFFILFLPVLFLNPAFANEYLTLKEALQYFTHGEKLALFKKNVVLDNAAKDSLQKNYKTSFPEENYDLYIFKKDGQPVRRILCLVGKGKHGIIKIAFSFTPQNALE
jgi:hypothetical protein